MTDLSESLQRCLVCYEQRLAYGCTTDELSEMTGLPWNTCNPLRYDLWERRMIVATPLKRRTRNGKHATVYVIAHAAPPSMEPVDDEDDDEAVKFGHEEKIRARAALYAVIMRDLDMGLVIPPELIDLGRWLDGKVKLGSRRENEKGG